jgi:hypothetical protein
MFAQIERDNIRLNFLQMDMPQERRSRIIRLARWLEDEGGDPDDFFAALYHYSRPENDEEFERLYRRLDLANWLPEAEDDGSTARRERRSARREKKADG